MRPLSVLVLALALAAPASAATTSMDERRGVLLVDDSPTFPLALLRPPPPDGTTPWGTSAWDEIASAGIDLLAAGPFGADWTDGALADAARWNAAAHARGIHTWVNLRELARAQPGTPEEARLRQVVETLRDDAGLALWKGADEPWLSRWPPSLLAHAYATTRALDPSRFSLLIHAPRGTVDDLRQYTVVGEVQSVDVYPVKYRVADPNLHWVGRWTRTLKDATPRRVVTTTLGICFSGSFDRAGSGAYVVPTRQQARYMAYDAIMNGARGLIWFGGQNPACFGPGDHALGWNWTYWTAVLRPLVRELGVQSRLYPALVRWQPGPRVRASGWGTQVMARRAGREVWVFAARHGRTPARVTISGLPRTVTGGWVYREGRRIRVTAGALADTFRRWDVHVYRLRVRPKR
jgi:hypothetical protein